MVDADIYVQVVDEVDILSLRLSKIQNAFNSLESRVSSFQQRQDKFILIWFLEHNLREERSTGSNQ